MTTHPNSHRIWPTLLEVQRPKVSRIKPKIETLPCDDKMGFSRWHLLALGLLPEDEALTFLEETKSARPSVVFNDLFEHVSRPLPFWWVNHFYQLGRYPDNTFGDFLVGYGIEELCRMQQLTLLGHYLHLGARQVKMNPAVTCFESWIESELYGPLTHRQL